MAQVEVLHGKFPRCSGCGEEFPLSLWIIDSRIREPYGKHTRPSSAPELVEFGRKHASCPSPIVETLPSGMVCVDRRSK